jgi:TPR repeat protein
MKSRGGIGLTALCLAVIFGAGVWWTHRASVIAWKTLSSAARETRARAENGDAMAEFQLARMYFDGSGVPKDYGEAVRWYRKAAEQGYAKAQFDLGQMYRHGKGLQQDYGEAARWYRKGAEQGDPKAQSALAYAYCNGEGVPLDYTEAARWYRTAAEQSYALAQQSLAYMYAIGEGVQQDDTQAAAWYRKAAEQGDAVAEQSLGYMYAHGRGVSKDSGQAVGWYRKAADQGDTNAKRALESLDIGSRPPRKTRYVELSSALLGFFTAFWCLKPTLGFLIRKRRLLGGRQRVIALLGIAFLANSGLSLYGFAHDVRYSHYHNSFHLARAFLTVVAILIIVTVVLPTIRRSRTVKSESEESSGQSQFRG